MRKGYEVIDPGEPNFVVQSGLKKLTDDNGRRVGTCHKTGKQPIRAKILDRKITNVYCGAVHTCLTCPFSSVLPDKSDFKKQS